METLLTYVGTGGGYIHGVPSRDLTRDDVAVTGKSLAELCAYSGPVFIPATDEAAREVAEMSARAAADPVHGTADTDTGKRGARKR